MIKFNSGETDSQTSLYTEATKLPPISKTKKDKVLKDYGIKTGWSKGKSDTAISKGAADAVLKKWKTDQAAAKKAADAAKKPTTTTPKTPTKVTQPTALSRKEAAAITRKYGLDPAKIMGWGTGNTLENYWVNQTSQAYIWRNAASFESWIKRVIQSKNASAYR